MFFINNKLRCFFDNLEDEMRKGSWIVLEVSTVIWSLVFFDIVGSRSGSTGLTQTWRIASTVVVIVLLLSLPWILYLVMMWKEMKEEQHLNAKKEGEKMVEMMNMTAIESST
jgi:1,4-dihydroxy-2-naphthoate octaprenyltransferase